MGRNPVSVVIPCHRVIGRNGSLTGYAGGLERKRALLELEGVWASQKHENLDAKTRRREERQKELFP